MTEKAYALCCPIDENGAFSAWSFMHVLSGYIWNLAWAGVSFAVSQQVKLQTLNLWLLMFIGFLFELAENNASTGEKMWRWLDYTRATYSGDSAINAISDMLFVLIGWTLVEGTLLISVNSVVFAILGAGALLLLIVFGVLFREERKILMVRERAAGVLPAVMIQ